jgi:enoyl-CoA hydratase/carnithine racemase
MQDVIVGATDNAPLRKEQMGRVLVLTLDRPEKRNPLSEDVIAGLAASIEAAGADPGVGAVVLASTGPIFSPGHDLKEMRAHRGDADGGEAYYRMLLDKCAAMMRSIVRSPKPFIAAVQGIATAAGCQLVASCDLAVAADNARFGTSGINNGLFCSTPMIALSRNVPRKRAMQMLVTGDLITAEQACEWGLVNQVVPAAELLSAAVALATKAAAQSPIAIALGKQAFYAQVEASLDEAYRLGSEAMLRNLMTCDGIEGTEAFIEKRKPVWTGR